MGYTQLNKEHLIIAICNALNIDTFTHHHAEGINTSDIKSKIKELRKQRDEALAEHDHKQLKAVRRDPLFSASLAPLISSLCLVCGE